MRHTDTYIDRRTYARPLRAVAIFVAMVAGVWELTTRGEVAVAMGFSDTLWLVRGTQVVVALGVAWLASPRRSITFLRVLIWILAYVITVGNLVAVSVVPAMAWETLHVVAFVIMGAALFAPWSWPWQAALAGSVGALTWLVVRFSVPPDVIAGWMESRIGLTLFVGVVASVLGTWVKERERRRVVLSEARFRSLFDAAADAIVVLTPDGVIEDCNLRFEALMDQPASVLQGRDFSGMIEATEGGRQGRRSLDRLLADLGPRPATVEGTLARPAAPPVDVEVTLARMPGPTGPIVQASLRDLTERRALERRRVQTQRVESIARMAGGLAHQFNNLLGGILNQATLLRKDAASPDHQAQLDAIAHAARRGERLTKELLRFTPHAAVSARPVEVSSIVESVLTLARSEETRGALTVETEADLPPVAADPDHVVPALMELVFNARDALGEHGDRDAIRLAVSGERVTEGDGRWSGARPGRYVSFAVIDRGRGMDAATRERLFEPFFTTKPMHEAEGLGLATVYWVVRAHGGAIAIDSTPGRGTTVRMLLPVAEAAPRSAEAPRRDAAEATVLVVDDDPLIRGTAERALAKFGYRVITAEDGQEALVHLAAAKPPVDLAILDVVMPGGGPTLMERIRENHPSVRVLVSSGYGPGGEVRRMLEMGAAGFLQKPYELTELRDAVADALQ